MLKKVQVPAAGQSKTFGITGVSFIVVSAPAYEKIEHVPLLSFNAPGSQLPALTRSIFGNPEGKFNRLAVTGTEQSEGDELTIFSTLACLGDFININALETRKAGAGVSFEIESSNVSQLLPEINLLSAAGDLPTKIYVSASGNNIKYAFNASPDQGVAGLGSFLLSEGVVISIDGINFIESFEFISAAADAHGSLTVHVEY